MVNKSKTSPSENEKLRNRAIRGMEHVEELAKEKKISKETAEGTVNLLHKINEFLVEEDPHSLDVYHAIDLCLTRLAMAVRGKISHAFLREVNIEETLKLSAFIKFH